MRKVILTILTLCLCACFNSTQAESGWLKKENKDKGVSGQPKTVEEKQIKKEEIEPQVDTSKIEKEKELELAKKNELLANRMVALNGTQWQIELVLMSDKEKRQAATLVFKDKQVSSTFTEGGFPTSNFTASISEDGSLVWETMQTSEKQGVLFWRGELSKDTASMRGIVSHQLPDNTTQDYSFSSVKKEAISAGQL